MRQNKRLEFCWGPAVFMACLVTPFVLDAASGACSKPNDDTEFCIDKSAINTNLSLVDSCSEANPVCTVFGTVQRNQFPQGSESADQGATKEEEADCWRTTQCVSDPDTGGCKAGTTGNWHDGDKVVNNPAVTCPAE